MRHYINILHPLFALLLLLAACSSDGDTALQQSPTAEQQPCTYRMTLRAAVEGYDDTRAATPYAFQGGDRVHVLFQQGSQTISGVATYDADSDEWDVTTSRALSEVYDGSCSLAFLPDAELYISMTAATLTPQSRIYTATAADYLFVDGQVSVQGTLTPVLGRIRFHGTAGQQCTVEGLCFPAGIDLTTHAVALSPAAVTATCAADGYSPYYYAAFADGDAPQLTVSSGDEYCFSKTFDRSVLAIGKSGYMDVPTLKSYKGWQLVDISDPLELCPNNKHPHAIDMGDGLKWACCNVGATSPIEYGDYFAWGETSTKSNYNWSTYKYCKGTSTTMTKYCNSSSYGTVDNKTQLELSDDAARAKWGGTWRMPTTDELRKLNTYSTWTWTTVGGVNGYKVTATNGNTLFFPAAGYRGEIFSSNDGSVGDYWSSSLYTSDAGTASGLTFYSNFHYNSYSSRCNGKKVRPVTE